MTIRNWMQAPTSVSHGYIIQREIFSKFDPSFPNKEGAIMKHVDSFCRAYIEPLCQTVPTTHDNIQEIFYVVKGEGEITVDEEEYYIIEGDAVIIPPNLEHTLKNVAEYPLEILILIESVPEGIETKKKPILKSYRESPIGQGHWNHLVHTLFTKDDGLIKLNAILIVGIEPMQTADTHGHNEGTDEIWYMLKGNGIHVVNRNVYRQKPGDAVSVAPSTGHSLINDTEQPLQTFYFAHYE